MFNIDRRYIDAPQFEETLQSKIITVRSKYRNDPTLPHADHFGVSDEEFEEYIDRKQDLLEWQKDMKRRGPLWLVILFCIPPSSSPGRTPTTICCSGSASWQALCRACCSGSSINSLHANVRSGSMTNAARNTLKPCSNGQKNTSTKKSNHPQGL